MVFFQACGGSPASAGSTGISMLGSRPSTCPDSSAGRRRRTSNWHSSMVPLIADNFVGLRHGTPDEPEPLSSKRPTNLKLSDDGHYQQITDDSGLSAKLGGFRGRAIGIDPQDRVHHSALRGLSRISQLKDTKRYIEVENRANTSIDVIEKLSRHQNIFGLKDASLDTGRLLSIYNGAETICRSMRRLPILR